MQDAFREYRYDDLLTLLRQRQRSGDPETMWAMGLYIGIGVGDFPSLWERNHTALRLTKRAALCGFPHAVNSLRVNYERGDLGVAPNPDRAKCLKVLWREQPGDSAAACGVRLNDSDEIINPLWDPQVELGRTRPR